MTVDTKLPERVPVDRDEWFTNVLLLPFLKRVRAAINTIIRVYIVNLSERIEALKTPVGGIRIFLVDTDPAALLGYGTWVEVGEGRVLVGKDTGDVDFDTLSETGGLKTHAHTDSGHAHGPGTHTHIGAAHSHTFGSHNHEIPFSKNGGALQVHAQTTGGTSSQRTQYYTGTGGTGLYSWMETTTAGAGSTAGAGDIATGAPSAADTGSGVAAIGIASSLQPYLVVKMWVRIL